jgi:type IV secretion system protein VirB9
METSVLFVRTAAPDGRERYYAFELHTREGNVADPADRAAYMTVAFRYAAPPPTPEAAAAWRARRDQAVAARAENAANARMASARASAPRNFAYDKRDPLGCPDLAPSYVFDDGNRTTLVFPPHAVLPQLYVVGSDGKEGIVTTINEATPNGLQVVVPSVHREMRLRRGGKVCAVRNNGFDPIGTEPGAGTGTVSADVVRRVRSP